MRHPNFPVCPVSFSDEERHQQNVDLKFHEREAVLETVLELLLGGEGIGFTEDGRLPASSPGYDLHFGWGIYTSAHGSVVDSDSFLQKVPKSSEKLPTSFSFPIESTA